MIVTVEKSTLQGIMEIKKIYPMTGCSKADDKEKNPYCTFHNHGNVVFLQEKCVLFDAGSGPGSQGPDPELPEENKWSPWQIVNPGIRDVSSIGQPARLP